MKSLHPMLLNTLCFGLKLGRIADGRRLVASSVSRKALNPGLSVIRLFAQCQQSHGATWRRVTRCVAMARGDSRKGSIVPRAA